MKTTHLVINGSVAKYALGAFWGPNGIDAILVAEIGRTDYAPTTGINVRDLDRLASAPQTSDVPGCDFAGRSIIGPSITDLGSQYCYPSIRTEDVDIVLSGVKTLAETATDGITPDEWASLVDGRAPARNN